VGIVFNFLIALRGTLRSEGFWNKNKYPNLRDYLDLVALGTIGDIVSLVDENRIFAKFGLELISQDRRVGIQALKKVCGLDGKKIEAEKASFALIPRIHAAGRIASAGHAVELLLSEDLNKALNIALKLEEFNSSLFQKKEGSRFSLFHDEELPLLAPLPATSYELAEWKVATVQFNYHISIGGMLYSVPFEYIKRKVDVRITDTVIEVFYQYNRIASHKRLYGRKAQYSTVIAHMPEDHQQYLEWNGNRFRKWAERIGPNTSTAVDAILSSKRVEQQTYKSCMGLLKLADRHSGDKVERACEKALSFTASPSYKSIKNILVSTKKSHENQVSDSPPSSQHAVTRGATYYGGKAND